MIKVIYGGSGKSQLASNFKQIIETTWNDNEYDRKFLALDAFKMLEDAENKMNVLVEKENYYSNVIQSVLGVSLHEGGIKSNVVLLILATKEPCKGYGTKLMKHLARHAKRNKVGIQLQSEESAVAFYYRCGFKEIGLDHVMELKYEELDKLIRLPERIKIKDKIT